MEIYTMKRPSVIFLKRKRTVLPGLVVHAGYVNKDKNLNYMYNQ